MRGLCRLVFFCWVLGASWRVSCGVGDTVCSSLGLEVCWAPITIVADAMVHPINESAACGKKCQRSMPIPAVEFPTAVYPRKRSSGVLCF